MPIVEQILHDNTWQPQVPACHLFIVVVGAALLAAAAVCSISADEDIDRRAILFCEYLWAVYAHIYTPVSSGFKRKLPEFKLNWRLPTKIVKYFII